MEGYSLISHGDIEISQHLLCRRVYAGGWRHRCRDLPHLHRDCVQAAQRRSQEADAAGLRSG